jgi:outer membrane protein assembly factor BamB
MRRSLLRAALGVAGLLLAATTLRADDWPQWLGPQRDGVWRETGILDTFPKGGPTIKWRKPIGSGYSGPAVANGRVYVLDRVLAKGAKMPKSGFDMTAIPGVERLLCFRESDGELMWQKEYNCPYKVSYAAGPRTTPTVADGKVYTLGTMGDLFCFDAEKGDVLWNKNLPTEYKAYGCKTPQWGFAGHPLIDGNRLICLVGGKGSTVVAFDKNTGRELWKNLTTEEPGYAPPVIYDHGGKRLLILWDAEAVNALNPETGELYWSQSFGSVKTKSGRKVQAGMSIATPRRAGDLLYVSTFYNGSLMLRLGAEGGKPTSTRVWEDKRVAIEPDKTTGLHCVNSTPILKDGFIYGACSYGEFRCLKEDTGERIWQSFKPTTTDDEPLRWGTVFAVAQGDRYFLFNEHGDLIIAKLSPKGYQEISRAHVLEPTNGMATGFGRAKRMVVWSHPAFAGRCMFARNDRELVCVSLAK